MPQRCVQKHQGVLRDVFLEHTSSLAKTFGPAWKGASLAKRPGWRFPLTPGKSHPRAIPPPNSIHAGLFCSPGDPTGRARTALTQLSFSQCFYREHLQALPFIQHILKEEEKRKKTQQRWLCFSFAVRFNKQQPSEPAPFYEVVFLHWSLSCVS